MRKLEIRPELKTISWLNPIHFLSLGFGSGLAPIAPGTFGTIAAIPVYLAMQLLPPSFYISLTLIFMFAGFWFCGYTAKALNTHDHPAIVWDEVVGLLITLSIFPFSWITLLLGFLLFRLFDIIKPWPISWLDKHVHGGVGIMLDDVLAGLMAWGCLWLISSYLVPLS
nr:phosphatidylglycerophosphatase A [Catenovulum maritimum]